jgi:hypothetical protein
LQPPSDSAALLPRSAAGCRVQRSVKGPLVGIVGDELSRHKLPAVVNLEYPKLSVALVLYCGL